MRTIIVPVLMISALIAACGPVKLRLETPSVEPAHLRTQVVKGDKPTVPTQCAMPCDIEIPHGTEQLIRVEAPGYYPAQFNVSWETVFRLEGGFVKPDSVLRVPLLPRGMAPAANEAKQLGAATPPTAKDSPSGSQEEQTK